MVLCKNCVRRLQVGVGFRRGIRGVHGFQGLNRGKNFDRGQSFKFGFGLFIHVCAVPSNVLDILQ